MTQPRPARALLLPALAFLAYGTWAGIANSTHGMLAAARAACVQGASSGLTTLVISGGIEAVFAAVRPGRLRTVVASLLPPTCSSLVHVAANLLAGTPELGRTVLPSIVLGYLFAILYVRTLESGAASVTPVGQS